MLHKPSQSNAQGYCKNELQIMLSHELYEGVSVHLARVLAALQDTLASLQHPLLGGKLEVTQAVPGGRWFLVPTPAFKVRPASNKQLMTFNTLKSTCTGPHPALTAGPLHGACAYKRTHAFLGPSCQPFLQVLQSPAPQG